jgi:hypothetical protein
VKKSFSGRKKERSFTRREEGEKVHEGGATDFNDLETKANVVREDTNHGCGKLFVDLCPLCVFVWERFFGGKRKGVFIPRDKGEKVHEGGCYGFFTDFEMKGNVVREDTNHGCGCSLCIFVSFAALCEKKFFRKKKGKEFHTKGGRGEGTRRGCHGF